MSVTLDVPFTSNDQSTVPSDEYWTIAASATDDGDVVQMVTGGHAEAAVAMVGTAASASVPTAVPATMTP